MPKGKNAASKIDSKAKKGGMKGSKKTGPAKGGVKAVSSQKSDGGEKRKIRFKPGTVALREIKRYPTRSPPTSSSQEPHSRELLDQSAMRSTTPLDAKLKPSSPSKKPPRLT